MRARDLPRAETLARVPASPSREMAKIKGVLPAVGGGVVSLIPAGQPMVLTQAIDFETVNGSVAVPCGGNQPD